MPLRIFISYGHDEHAELVHRLKNDLGQLGHDVWVDEAEIKGGRDWELAIEDGLKATNVVIAALTRHAVRRPDGVCLDEISFARFLRRQIVPLMVEWCQPPLSISRLQWLDFQKWREEHEYKRRFEQLRVALEKHGEVEFEGGQSRLLDTLDPLVYDAELQRLGTDFTGRKWVLQDFESWLLDSKGEKIFLLTGPPGVGKSSITSYLCQKHPAMVGYHFCRYNNQEKSNALRCVQSLAYQMSTQLPDYRDLLLAIDLCRLPKDAATVFDRIVTQPLQELPRPERPQMLVLDAVDEATAGNKNELVDLIATEFEKTPDWLRLLVTSRPEKPVLRKLSAVRPYPLEKTDDRNLDDIRAYVSTKLCEHKRGAPAEAVNTIVRRSEGIFLYVEMVLEELRKGRLSLGGVDQLPEGLKGWFTFQFERYLPDLDHYRQYQRPLLELVAVARDPLPLSLAAWVLNWDEYTQADILKPLHPVFPETCNTLQSFHQAVMEWLTDPESSGDYYASQSEGTRRLAEACQKWRNAPPGQARDYLLRHGTDHVLEQERRSAGPVENRTLALCRGDKGLFLIEAVRCCGVQRIKEQIQTMFEAYLEMRSWSGAAGALVHLRALHEAAEPLRVALSLVADSNPQGAPEAWLRSLEIITDDSVQRSIMLLALARLEDRGQQQSVVRLLDWLTTRHAGSMTLGLEQFDSECLRAVLYDGPLPLAERLIDLPLYLSRNEQLSALAAVWTRNPGGRLRQQILERLTLTDDNRESFSVLALHSIASMARKSGDDEILLGAMRLIGMSDVSAQIEELNLGRLLDRPKTIVLECIRWLCQNPRLRKYPSLRADVAGIVLLGTAARDAAYLEELTRDLSEATGAGIAKILYAMAQYSAIAVTKFSMMPAEFHCWLAARLTLLSRLHGANVGPARVNTKLVNALRKLMHETCKAIRWIAAQAEISNVSWKDLQVSLETVSGLAWSDPQNWGTPFVVSSPANVAADWQVDPIRAYAIADTTRWLAKQGWPTHYDAGLHESLYRSSAHELARLVFKGTAKAHLAEIQHALAAASRAPQPNEWGSLEGSPWIEVFQAIARSVGDTWEANWTTNLNDRYVLPEHLKSLLKRLRGRVAEVADDTGFHPFLLELLYYLTFATGEEKPTDNEMDDLVLPALANMDANCAGLILHHVTWPPHFAPLLYAGKVPKALAQLAASLELCNRGLLWGLARDMCRPKTDPVWRQSVAEFRTGVREEIKWNPHPRIIWYEKDEPPEHFVEAALAPVNLLLDTPPRKKDFDELAGEVNLDPSSSCLRLKELVSAHPRAELLRWVTEEFSGWKSEQAMWVVRPLLRNREWILLHKFLSLQFQQGTKEQDDHLSGFPPVTPSEAARTRPTGDWRAELAKAVGLGPEEGLIYRVDGLAYRALSGSLFEDEKDVAVPIRQYRDKVRYTDHWQDRVREIFQSESTRRDELVLTLLAVALLKNDSAAALLADELVAVTPDELEKRLALNLAWTGRAVCGYLARDERLTRIAASGNGLDLLASLGRWDLVRQHLEACARSRPTSVFDQDPLLQWYHQCDSLAPEEQLRCLRIFDERAPSLLALRPENTNVIYCGELEAMLPVNEVSETFRFAEYSLSQKLLPAAHGGAVERLKLWFKAVLTEARYGPKQGRELKCFQTLCRCAGIVLSIVQEQHIRDEWFSAIEKLSSEFDTREVWNSFFGGAGMSLGANLGKELDRWYVPGDTGAILALGEELAEYGELNNVRDYWSKQIERSGSPWVALRACAAVISRIRHRAGEGSDTAREFASLAWNLTQGRNELRSPQFLAEITDYGVELQSSSVLRAVSDLVASDSRRAPSIARIALNSYLASLPSMEPSEDTDEGCAENQMHVFLESDGIRQLMTALIAEGSRPTDDSEDLADYRHTWLNIELQCGIKWIAILIREIAKHGQPVELLKWMANWIKRINPRRDERWQVAERISNLVMEMSDENRGYIESLLDFAISSAAVEHGSVNEQVALILKLMRARYRIADCLTILDRSLEKHSQTAYVDNLLAKVAAACAELFPNEPIAETYLARMLLPADKAVAVDQVAERRCQPRVERLENLKRAQQCSEVAQRLISLCEGMVTQLPDLRPHELAALGGVLSRVVLDQHKVYRHLALRISQLLQEHELIQVHEDHERLRPLFARSG